MSLVARTQDYPLPRFAWVARVPLSEATVKLVTEWKERAKNTDRRRCVLDMVRKTYVAKQRLAPLGVSGVRDTPSATLSARAAEARRGDMASPTGAALGFSKKSRVRSEVATGRPRAQPSG